ncbi:MAG: hypothetical protein LBT05_10965 [Planctomycetaceae bacterium]|jgi:hypothetical protein|nr:hypothetical protein [Planctomycetaceae bacterium]
MSQVDEKNERRTSQQLNSTILGLLEQKKESSSSPDISDFKKTQTLSGFYSAFIGVAAMILTIGIGWIRGVEADLVLTNSFQNLLIYCGIGFLAGKIAEMCVQESAKSMIRETLNKIEEHENDV